MLYKGLNIVNCDCIRYFQLMKDNQYLAIIDQEGIIKASFIKMNGKFMNILTYSQLNVLMIIKNLLIHYHFCLGTNLMQNIYLSYL